MIGLCDNSDDPIIAIGIRIIAITIMHCSLSILHINLHISLNYSRNINFSLMICLSYEMKMQVK